MPSKNTTAVDALTELLELCVQEDCEVELLLGPYWGSDAACITASNVTDEGIPHAGWEWDDDHWHLEFGTMPEALAELRPRILSRQRSKK